MLLSMAFYYLMMQLGTLSLRQYIAVLSALTAIVFLSPQNVLLVNNTLDKSNY